MRVVAERDVRTREFAPPLDVDVFRTVHQDVADAAIPEKRLDRAKSCDFVDDLLDDLLTLRRAQRRLLGADELDDCVPNLRRQERFVGDALERREVETFDELAVQLEL